MSDILGTSGTFNLTVSGTLAASDHAVDRGRIFKAITVTLFTNGIACRIAYLTLRKKRHDKINYS